VSSAQTLTSIILASYDVGEADRFLVLLTREKGRLTARARGVRKLGSRLGGTLLPLHAVTVEIHESSSSRTITSAVLMASAGEPSFARFLMGTEASELLLSLLEDEEPVPEIFDNLRQLLTLPFPQPQHLLSFCIRTLSLLGVLAETTNTDVFEKLSLEEKLFLEHSARGLTQETVNIGNFFTLPKLCKQLIFEHATRPLRAAGVTAACR